MATLERIGPAGHDLVVLDESRGRLSIGKSTQRPADHGRSRRLAGPRRAGALGPAWCITDVSSTNGTYVNGERIFAPVTLADRAEILVGRTRLILNDPAAGATSRPSRCGRTTEDRRRAAGPGRAVPSRAVGPGLHPPSSVRAIAEALYVTDSAVKQHLDHLYDKFGIRTEPGESRRVRLANEAIQTGAVTLRDLSDPL